MPQAPAVSQGGFPLTRPLTGLLSCSAAELMSPGGSKSRSWLLATSPTGKSAPQLALSRSFDRSLAGRERERQQAGATVGGVRVSGFRSDGGPSSAAQRENFKKAQHAVKIERGEEIASARGQMTGHAQQRSGLPGRDALDSLADRTESVEVLAEAFRESVKDVDHRLEDLTRSLRYDKFGEGKEDAAERERREAERQRREADLRKARKREQEAHDPHKKVELRLDTRRLENKDNKAVVGVPMKKIEIVGETGRESVELVDVRLLRSRCQQLDEGASVQSMIDMQRQRELAKRLLASRKASSKGMAFSMPDLHSYEERREKVLTHKEVNHLGVVLRRLNSMRSELPDQLPCSFQAMQQHLEKERLEQSKGCSPQTSPKSAEWHQLSQQVASKFADWDGPPSPTARKTLDAMSPGTPLGLLRRKTLIGEETKAAPEARMTRNKTTRFLVEPVIAKRLGQLHWIKVRASVHLLILLSQVRSKNKNIDTVKAVLRDIGEWTRMKLAVQRMIGAVKILQVKSREFLSLKRRRVDGLQREWMRVEDFHLDKFFKRYSEQVMAGADNASEESNKSPIVKKEETKKKEDLNKKLLEGVKSGGLAFDWKRFRIPAKQRRQVLSCYYMSQLRKRVRTRSCFVAVIHEMVRSQHELVGFLDQFGASMSPRESLFFASEGMTTDVSPPNFWQISEDMLLQLISVCAHGIRHVEPFRDHPAMRDIPGNPMHRPPLNDASSRASVAEGEADDLVISQAARLTKGSTSGQGRPVDQVNTRASILAEPSKAGSASVQVSPERAASDSGKASPQVRRKDLEDIFDCFTPRLREIAEEQTMEYRINSSTRAPTPLVTQ